MTTPTKRSRRNHRSAKKAGTRFERSVADYLAATLDDRIDRRVKAGNKDCGDIGGVRRSPVARASSSNAKTHPRSHWRSGCAKRPQKRPMMEL